MFRSRSTETTSKDTPRKPLKHQGNPTSPRTIARHIASFFLVCIALPGCQPVSDPVFQGELCTQSPEDTLECSARAILERGSIEGRNALDYEVTNQGDETRRVIVRIGPAALFEEVLTEEQLTAVAKNEPMVWSDAQLEELEGSEFYVVTSVQLEPMERFIDRFTADELGREARLWFSVSCAEDGGASCDLVTQYVLLIDPLECITREDCLSGWDCDAERGRCLECIEGENMCATGQTCELGRCTPPLQSSCQVGSSGSSPAPPLSWLISAMALMALSYRAHRRRANTRKRQRGSSLMRSVICVAALLYAPALQAQQTSAAELTVGSGVRVWTGEAGKRLRAGLGFELEQDLFLYRAPKFLWIDGWTPRLGLGVKMGAFTFVGTDQSATTALNRSHQNYPFEVGLRVRQRLWRELYVKLATNYVRMGVGGSALLELTGLQRTFHGAGASLRVGYLFEPVVIEAELGYKRIVGIEGDVLGLSIKVGVSNITR